MAGNNIRVHVSSIWRMKRNSPFLLSSQFHPGFPSKNPNLSARHGCNGRRFSCPTNPRSCTLDLPIFVPLPLPDTRQCARGRIGWSLASESPGLLSRSLISQIACNLPSLSRRYASSSPASSASLLLSLLRAIGPYWKGRSHVIPGARVVSAEISLLRKNASSFAGYPSCNAPAQESSANYTGFR